MNYALAGLTMIVDVPDLVYWWKPTRNRRSAHWPRPNECDDLASFLVYRHYDLPDLDDDGLRDQRLLGQSLLGNLLARSGSEVAEQWLRERLAAIAGEMRARQPLANRERRRDSGYRPRPSGPPPSLLDRLQSGAQPRRPS